jgi:putative ABC transport system substrate-binding protein
MMNRRSLLVAGLTLLATPLVAGAQERKARKVYRIGCMPGGPLAPRAHQWEAFRLGLRDLGYVEGQNVVLEYRVPEREGAPFDDLVADLVRLNVDVIVASTPSAIQAAKRATKTIPIVMTGIGDPVKAGLIASLARPGGNVTGLSLLAVELGGKRLHLLREVLPKMVRVAVLWNPTNPHNLPQLQEVQAAASILRLEALSLEASTADDIDRAFQIARNLRADGLVVASDGLFFGLHARILDLALQTRLPAVWVWPSLAERGALMVYGTSDTEYYRRAAAYVDRILKGVRPADLPVEQPTKIDLIISLKTARALKLTIPRSLLLRADQVIE